MTPERNGAKRDRVLRVTRCRIKSPSDPDRPYVVNVYDRAWNLILWCGPLSLRDRDATVRLFRERGW